MITRFNFHSIFNKCLDKTKKMDILYNQQQKGYLSTPINKSGKLAGKSFYILFMMLLLEVNGMDAHNNGILKKKKILCGYIFLYI